MKVGSGRGVYRRGFVRLGRIVLVVVGYASIVLGLLALPEIFKLTPVFIALSWLTAALCGALAIRLLRRLSWETAFEILVLGILPPWGALLNESLSPCRVDACDDIGIYRPFATPELYWLLALHAGCALAYWVSRRRPGALRPAAECLLLGALTVGVGIDVLATVQTVKLLPFALALPITMPLLAPGLSFFILLAELRARAKRRALDAPELARHPARLLPLPILGMYAALEGLFVGRTDAFTAVVTETCTHPFSRLTLEILHEQNCHYLCTVAARGHAGLVRPLRLGVRRGQPILVNRQLQVANAFEDLLHTRWPRFGRLARRIYDLLGLPISRFIDHPLAADAVYLVMKPAEWLFYLALLLFDPEAPEARIDRQYRGG